MSLNKIKQKETKGKKNVLPKLRTVLANPYKRDCPVLPEIEVDQLLSILEAAKANGGHSIKRFATQSRINLGLQSCLRAIQAERFSCILISLSLRPVHLIRLIATSATVRVKTAGVFAQPKLEELTYKLFGVRSMALALPLELKNISEELDIWVRAHTKPAPAIPDVFPRKRKIKEKVKVKPILDKPPSSVDEEKPLPDGNKDKQWSGDYISCSNRGSVNRMDIKLEAKKLGAALNNLAMKAQTKPVNQSQSETQSEVATEKSMEIEISEPENDDDFLPTDLAKYRPLTINVLRPNPNKKPKKKRNKKPANKTK